MAEPIIQIENLSKSFLISHERRERYSSLRDEITNRVRGLFSGTRHQSTGSEEFWALKDVTFNIEAGDRVGIIGRNGAGKSTLLKVLSRITEPTSGRICLNGKVASLLEVGTGFHPELTGRENIFLNGAILGMSRAEIRRKFDEIVAFAEVERFLDTPVKRYSSGMYVRLAFAVAAHLEPEILIVDEVLAVGDAQFQKKCLGKMEDVSKNEGRTVLFVSHNMGVIAQLCNRGVLLSGGKISLVGTTDEVINLYINNSTANKEQYVVAESKKTNYFTRIHTANRDGETCSDFAFDESIIIRFEFRLLEPDANLMIGIGLQDRLQNRVATILKPLNFFRKRQDGMYTGSVELPSSIIAPGDYSLVCVLWVKDVVVFDNVENVCPFHIHDNGSELALYEGSNYGNMILNPVWRND